MQTVYDYPRYYEIAFSYRDIPAEVDTFETCFSKYAQVPVKNILEIACGNSPHLEELIKRGYAYTGLDLSQPMLAYSSKKASCLAGEAEFVHADMVNFTTVKVYDFAFIALGSLNTQNTQDIFSHFRSVAGVLNKGCLYLLDWCVHFPPFSNQEESWSMEEDDIRVDIHWTEKLLNAPKQLVEEKIILDVVDNDSVLHLEESGIHRVIFPQEFRQIVEHSGEFDFVGWWNNWNLEKPLSEIIDPTKIIRPIILLRRQ